MRRLLLGSALAIASLSMLACASDDADESGGETTPRTTATTEATSDLTATVTTEPTTATATTTAAPTTEATATETASAGGDDVTTEIARFTFETPIEIAVGTSVTWTNTEEPHTVTARDGSFDSDRIPQGDSFTHTFEEAGTFEYFCQIHPAMEGTVVVE